MALAAWVVSWHDIIQLNVATLAGLMSGGKSSAATSYTSERALPRYAIRLVWDEEVHPIMSGGNQGDGFSLHKLPDPYYTPRIIEVIAHQPDQIHTGNNLSPAII